jgi:hypothetical protein
MQKAIHDADGLFVCATMIESLVQAPHKYRIPASNP